MVVFVLGGPGKQAVQIVPDLLAGQIVGLEHDLLCPFDRRVISGKLRQPSSASTVPLRRKMTGLRNTCSGALVGSPSRFRMNKRYGRLTWLAARPMPFVLIHQIKHPANDLFQLAIDLKELLRLVSQGRMRIFDDLQHIRALIGSTP